MNSPTAFRISKEEARASRAMVATKHERATRAGLEVLELGGNAIDAAIAACFATGVVEPNAATIGGGGYIVYQMGDRCGVIGGHMRAPLEARPDMFRLTGNPGTGTFGWAEVEGGANLEGPLSIGTPGVVAAMCEAHRLFGHLRLEDVIAPAVRLARNGFTPHWHNLYAFGLLAGNLFQHEELRRIFMPGGAMPKGDFFHPGRLRQPELADVMEAIGREGPDVFYKGEVAGRIAEDIQACGGILSRKDFDSYTPFVWDGGLQVSYRGHTVILPPHATAGITTAMTLKLMDRFDFVGMGHNRKETLHAFICSTRLAYADRYAYLADPETVDVPWRGLLSDVYTDRRRAQIGDRVPDEWKAGDPWVEEGRRPEVVHEPSAPLLNDGTTHLCAVDGDGNAVSFTNTIGFGFGSGVVPKGTGIVMNNAMAWFDPVPGRINSILSGRWPLNNATPAIVRTKDGRLMPLGASGGRRITNAVSQMIANIVDFGMGPQAAIDAPRVDCSTPRTSVPEALDATVRGGLEARGHQLKVVGSEYPAGWITNFASPTAIVRDSEGNLTAGVDTFHSAHAEGL